MIKKFLKLLEFVEKKDKKKLYFIQFQIILVSFLEIISLSLIIPFIKLASDESSIDKIYLLNKFYNFLNFESHSAFTIFSGLVLIFAFVLSSIFTLWTRYNIVTFSQNLSAYLANKLFKNILAKDYLFYVDNSLSKIMRILNDETTRLISGVIFPALIIVSKLFLIFFILLVLLNHSIVTTISLSITFLIIYFFIYRILKEKISIYGVELSNLGIKKIKFIDDTYNSIKEIKVYNKSRYFSDKFSSFSNKVAKIYSFVNIASIFPRYLIDMVGFAISIFAIIFLIIFSEQNLTETFSILAFYSLAAYRLIPAFQEIYSSSLNIKNNAVSIELIKNISDNLVEKKSKSQIITNFSNFDHSIFFRNIIFKYKNSKSHLFNNLDFKIEKNKNIIIVGETGSGKSTILDIIMGLNKPESFDLFIDSKKISNEKYNSLVGMMSYVSQSIMLTNDTLLQNICLGEDDNYKKDKLDLAIEVSHLNNVISTLKQGLNTKIGDKGSTLSGGQIQRVGIARAIYFDKPIIILDEATNSLDFKTELKVLKSLLLLKGKSIIFVTHNINNIKMFDELYHVKNNKINYHGDPKNFEKEKYF